MHSCVTKLMLSVVLLSAAISIGEPVDAREIQKTSSAASQSETAITYSLELSRWNIYNDGTHPVETTKGFNDALKWAQEKGITVFKVPAGTYKVKKADPALWSDPTACINMVPNMTFELHPDAVIQKETNAKESYSTVCIGYGADNVTLKGGTYKGDKDTHDYSKKENASTPGTHENGIGILVKGAKNLTIDNVKGVNFTGDGLAIGGNATLLQDLYPAHFESGSLDSKGLPVTDAAKIRMKNVIQLNKEILKKEPYFEMPNAVNLPYVYDLYFYKADGSFLTTIKVDKARQVVQIPSGASSFRAVFKKSSTAGVYAEFWNKALAKNVVVKNSEFAFNRRQGITVGGADNVLITTSIFHDMKGTAPESGIDVEGGFGENGMLNKNISIKENKFYNNNKYDVILYDGQDATVEGNHLASKGKIGLAVSTPFTNASVKNNHFDGTSIYAYHDVHFLGNKMNDSFTFFEGPNVTIDGMTFTDSNFSMTPKTPFGVEVKNVIMHNNKPNTSGLGIWKNPVKISNLTMNGTASKISGSAVGNIYEGLKIYGYSLGGMSLPSGTYNGCVMESAAGTIPAAASGIGLSGSKYVFNDCSFKTNGIGMQVTNPETDIAVTGSTFNVASKMYALKATKAKKVQFENNKINSTGFTSTSDYSLMIGDYWTRNNPYTVKEATIRGNTITANMAGKGISTIYAGTGAPSYLIENNILYNAKLDLKANDINRNNQQLTK